MMLPPLTADVSLYKSSGHYRSSGSAATTGGVMPQADGYPWGCLGCLLAACASSFWCQTCDDMLLLPPPVDLVAVIGCYLACCGATGFTECGDKC
jgi:hypothetical protein